VAIVSFKAKYLEALYVSGSHRRVPPDFKDKILYLLDHLNAAGNKQDLQIAGFHELKGNRKGTYAWKVSGNWRLTFRFEDGEASDIDLEDYH
jgi:proteic killer suppression protein